VKARKSIFCDAVDDLVQSLVKVVVDGKLTLPMLSLISVSWLDLFKYQKNAVEVLQDTTENGN